MHAKMQTKATANAEGLQATKYKKCKCFAGKRYVSVYRLLLQALILKLCQKLGMHQGCPDACIAVDLEPVAACTNIGRLPIIQLHDSPSHG
jgi:hypothetical protein